MKIFIMCVIIILLSGCSGKSLKVIDNKNNVKFIIEDNKLVEAQLIVDDKVQLNYVEDSLIVEVIEDLEGVLNVETE